MDFNLYDFNKKFVLLCLILILRLFFLSMTFQKKAAL